MNASVRCRLIAAVVALVLGAIPGIGRAQVFLASRPHPEFAIGPLLIVAGVRPDLGPVTMRVSFGLTLPPNGHIEDVRQDLYLLWPAEVAGAETTRAEVVQWCGPPSEERTRLGSGGHQTLFYRATRASRTGTSGSDGSRR
jgi:hypothetical protein